MICQECNGTGCSFCEGSGYVCNYCKEPYEYCDCASTAIAMKNWTTNRKRRTKMDGWVQVESPAPHLMAFQKDLSDGHLTVFVGVETDSRNRPWWHLSISHRTNEERPKPGRIPTYEEIRDARYRFLPDDVLIVEMFPPRDKYVDLHPTTRHLWQIPMEFLE